jgi:hypothetical protein
MRTELLAELRAIMRGEYANGTPVTPATPVTPRSGNRPKALELQALQRLQVDASNVETANSLPVTVPVPSSPEPYEAEMEERAGLAADLVPLVYLDAWARLNHQKPSSVSETEWCRALDEGGRFLDRWGYVARAFGWTPGEIFDVSAGLVWRLSGEPVEFIGSEHVKLSGGRVIRRTEMKVRA